VLEIQANHMNALINQGVELGRLEKNEEAIACYDKALEIYPNHMNALFSKGVALGGLEKNEEAIACYDKV